MNGNLQTITEQALALDPESRAALIDTLASSMAEEHEFLDEKLDELDRRWESIENGEARLVSIDEAVRNARRSIAC
jgi:hypothetical protein